MEKVICDVCGTDYPETAAQCPLCGCARADGGQTSAGNTEEGYTYTKGGRFSKSNVRKRLKAAQIQPVPVEIPVRNTEPEEDPEYDDYDEDEVDEEPSSNRGLIVIVVLLLMAIIAVSSYIAIVHFDIFGGSDVTKPVGTTAPPQSTTAPTGPSSVEIPCTGLTVNAQLDLTEKGKTAQLSFSATPIDTTDKVTFSSSNKSVATVDAFGKVTAVGSGEAVITVSCGAFVKECKVTCDFSSAEKPSDPTQPSEPQEPVLELKLKSPCDFTVKIKGYTFSIYNGEIDVNEITWSSDDESIATVKNGRVTCVGVGTTNIRAVYKGQVATCIIRNKWTEEPAPSEPTEPDTPAEPADPADPSKVYSMKINDVDPLYPTGTNACEVSIKVGDSILLTVVNGLEARMNVTWSAAKDGYVTIEGNKITGTAGSLVGVVLTTTYDGQTFTCLVRISE